MVYLIIELWEIRGMGILDLFHKKPKIQVGDVICFGQYFYEHENDRRPIEWIVLDSDKTGLVLISRYCLDTIHYCQRPYQGGSLAWETSHLRNWLNTVFYNQAFSDQEKETIAETHIVTDKTLDPDLHKNKVFLLSDSQIEAYFPDSEKRKGFPTPYARQRGAGAGIDLEAKAVWWWTMPRLDGSGCYPCVVLENGSLQHHSRLTASPGSDHAAVRPAIKIKK